MKKLVNIYRLATWRIRNYLLRACDWYARRHGREVVLSSELDQQHRHLVALVKQIDPRGGSQFFRPRRVGD